MRIVGLTGGIASGKSTVSREFQANSIPVVDADKVAHAALKKGTGGWKKVVATFGRDILQENGEVNRALLGQIVFADPAKRQLLNRALAPYIGFGIYWEILKLWIMGYQTIVLDVPLLFEAKMNWLTKPIIVVWLDSETQLQRLIARDGISEEQALNRIRSQMPLDSKRERADIVIDNSGSLEATKEQIRRVSLQMTAPLTWKEYIRSRTGVLSITCAIAFLVLAWTQKSS
uniref:Dephospho-CoA kinase n=1 Tax=Araucaria cunninghamii TaxID=56994 RepID=A0A0D6R7D2_ARACU